MNFSGLADDGGVACHPERFSGLRVLSIYRRLELRPALKTLVANSSHHPHQSELSSCLRSQEGSDIELQHCAAKANCIQKGIHIVFLCAGPVLSHGGVFGGMAFAVGLEKRRQHRHPERPQGSRVNESSRYPTLRAVILFLRTKSRAESSSVSREQSTDPDAALR